MAVVNIYIARSTIDRVKINGRVGVFKIGIRSLVQKLWPLEKCQFSNCSRKTNNLSVNLELRKAFDLELHIACLIFIIKNISIVFGNTFH